MKNQIKKTLKKSLSLMMAVLMVLSCWVWIAPTEAEAVGDVNGDGKLDYKDGYYYIKLTTNVNDTGNEDGSTITFTYKTNNGMGETAEFVQSYGQQGWDGASTVFEGYIPGYPTALHWHMDIGNQRSENHRDITLWVGKDKDNCKTVALYNEGYKFEYANWVVTETKNLDCYLNVPEGIENPRPTSMMNLSDAANYIPVYENKTVKFNGKDIATQSPKANQTYSGSKFNSFENNNGIVNISIPDINNPEALISNTFTAQAVDQYGVYWYTPAVYAIAQSNRSQSDISNEEAGLWWDQTSDKLGAIVNVNSLMQESFQLSSGNVKDYYLVAFNKENNGQAIAAKTLHFTYPKYDWNFDAEVAGLRDRDVSIIVEDRSSETVTERVWDEDSNGIPDTAFVKNDYLAYGQQSVVYPVRAEKEGFTFYGFWTNPQPVVAGMPGDPFSKEANFAQPTDTSTYNSLSDEEKALYTDAGEQWNARQNARTTNNKTYYAWWLSDDVSVKFYDVDGSYIDSFDVKAGNAATAINNGQWPIPNVEYKDSYTNGAFTYTTWTGDWVNIDGTVIDPDTHIFKGDLILTPKYEKASFDKKHNVLFYNINGIRLDAFSKEYNYRDTAVVPGESDAGQLDPYGTATDYTYTFEGWSTQAPSTTGVSYHVMLEEANYDANGNYVALASDFIVRSDATYYPVFRRHAKPYNVTFNFTSEAGVINTKVVVPYKYGQTIEIPAEVPQKYARFGREYTLIEWRKGNGGPVITLGEEFCTGTATYYAGYDAGVQKPYDITFSYPDSTNAFIETVAPVNHGMAIGQTVINALKPNENYDDGENLLTFSDTWQCSNGNIYKTADLAAFRPESHLTFTAIYEDGIPFRTVTYVDGDVIKDFRITQGTKLPLWLIEINGADGVTQEEYIPTKPSTEHGSYKFIGWFDEAGNQYIPGTTEVAADVTLHPEFEYELYKYNFVFKNWNGDVLIERALNYGDSLAALQRAAEALAVRGADAIYTYQFLGWDNRVPEKCEGGVPDSTMTFIAQYKPVYIYYDVNWFNDEAAYDANGTAVATSKYVYGDRIHAPSVTLTLPESTEAGREYVFAGWFYKDAQGNEVQLDRNMTVTGNMKFYAKYALTAKTWKVTVKAGTTTYTLTVADGAKINDLVAAPVAGYVDTTKHNAFTGWTLDVENGTAFDIENAVIKADTTIVANFTEGEHSYDYSEVVTYPSYPMAGYTDYDGTVVPATTGEGLRRFWCECNKEKTGTTELEKCKIPALKDAVIPGSTAYIGTSNWSDFGEAADADTIYANPNTDFIITTSDKGTVDNEFNKTGKGIGIQSIIMMIAPAGELYDEEALSMMIDANGETVYNWTQIQALLIANYGGWAKVPEMYKDYNANYTAKLSSFNLTDGETYVAYAKVTDKEDNSSYIRTAEFVYDATKPAVEVTGNFNAAENTYCEQAVIKVTEETDYTITVDGVVITEKTANHKYTVTGEGMRKVVVTDKAGNKVTTYFTVLKEHNKVAYNQAATCLNAGFTSERCLNCGADFNKTDIDALDHDYNYETVAATCTENGYIVTTCNRCDLEPERNEYIKNDAGEWVLLEEALGHAWDEGRVAKAATCQTKGVKIFTCSVCHTTKQEEIDADANAHSFYKAQTVAPTCTEAGQVTRLCRVCGVTVVIWQGTDNTAANYNKDYAPKGHTADKWVAVEALRCYAYGKIEGKDYFGSEKNVCSICDTDILVDGNAVMRYTYEAAAHTWIVDEANCVEPTVGVKGKIAYKCAVDGCPATREKEVDALVEYSITFVGVTVEDGADKETTTVIKNLPGVTVDSAALPEQKKLNSADGKVAYVFDGWYTKKADGSFDKKYTLPMEIGTADITLYAKFKEKDIFYTVDFKVPTTYTPATETEKEIYGEYKAVKSLMGAIGDTRIPGETPTFAETDYYTFTFDGWYSQGTNPTKYDGKIAGDGTYQAKFTAEAKSYKVIFMNEGIAYDSVDVTAGGTATAKGTPSKAADSEYHYTFKGWYTSADGRTPATLTDITEKLTVYAVYDKAAHTADETKTTVKQDATCVLPEITEYTCVTCEKTWVETTDEALGHTEGAPVYNEETGKNEVRCTVCGELLREADASYTIKFENYDGQRLGTATVKVNCEFYEQAAEAEALAMRKADDANEYTFAGWIVKAGDTPLKSNELPVATADVTYIAAYTAKARTFSVTFATSTLVTGSSVAKKTFSGIAYGKVLDKDGNDVTKYAFDEKVFGIPASDSKVHYVFKGWDADFSNGVTKDTLVRPVYEAVKHTFGDGVASAATCTESGGYKYTCSECGYYYITGNVPAQGHNYVTKVVKEPTYKEEGLAIKTCQRCGDTVEEKLPVKQYITVKVTVKDSNGKAFHGAKVEITHHGSGKVYGPNLTDTSGVATFYVEESGKFFVRVLEIPGLEGGMSGDITVNDKGEITSNTVPVPEGESNKNCSCACHRDGFWGMFFRFFHKIIKLFAGRYVCCECPSDKY